MSNQDNIKTFRNNPDLFKDILSNIAEEIVNGNNISSDHGRIEVPKTNVDLDSLKNTIFMTKEHMQQNFKAIVKDNVNDVFERLEIPQKCLQLCNWEQNTEDRVAWRPTTAEIPLSPLIANFLETTKRKLQRKLIRHKREADELQKLLDSHKSCFKKNTNDMENIIENASQLISQTDKLVDYQENI